MFCCKKFHEENLNTFPSAPSKALSLRLWELGGPRFLKGCVGFCLTLWSPLLWQCLCYSNQPSEERNDRTLSPHGIACSTAWGFLEGSGANQQQLNRLCLCFSVLDPQLHHAKLWRIMGIMGLEWLEKAWKCLKMSESPGLSAWKGLILPEKHAQSPTTKQYRFASVDTWPARFRSSQTFHNSSEFSGFTLGLLSQKNVSAQKEENTKIWGTKWTQSARSMHICPPQIVAFPHVVFLIWVRASQAQKETARGLRTTWFSFIPSPGEEVELQLQKLKWFKILQNTMRVEIIAYMIYLANLVPPTNSSWGIAGAFQHGSLEHAQKAAKQCPRIHALKTPPRASLLNRKNLACT